MEGPKLHLNVIPAEAPVRLEAFGTLNVTYPEQAPLGSRQIGVFGYYADGTRRTLTKAMLGTTYTSSNPEIATVDANGLVTATGTGITYITVENQGIRTFTEVVSEDPTVGELPPLDYTARVSIGTSGFRHDPESGMYVQEVMIRNDSDLPLSRPLQLVITGLPEGVELENSRDTTDKVSPIGSPVVWVEVEEDTFLSPGNTATAKLIFTNYDEVPITYTPKLFTGLNL
jgi:hypothetical protein